MTTLFDACLEVARFCLPAHAGIATGGSTTTLADTNYTQTAGYFIGGTIFFLTGNNAGKFARILNHASNTFTFAAQASACADGNHYVAFPPRNGKLGFWLPDMINAVNAALREIGDALVENTALTTVADQEEYALPTGVSRVRRVEVARETSEPYEWMEIMPGHWKETPGGKIRLLPPFVFVYTGYTLRLTYRGQHAYVDDAADTISRYVDLNWLKYTAVVNLLRSYANMGNLREDARPLMEEAQARAMQYVRPVEDLPMVRVSGW